MTGNAKRMPEANSVIKCTVNTCHYYGTGDNCHADKIEVQSPDAKSSEMTDCSTFLAE